MIEAYKKGVWVVNPLITSKKKPHFIVLAGDGINCERETAWAFEQAGGHACIVHINDLLKQNNGFAK